jgi:hypothetical protein
MWFAHILHPCGLFPGLNFLIGRVDQKRQLAAVELRKQVAEHWTPTNFSQEMRNQIKQAFLQRILAESTYVASHFFFSPGLKRGLIGGVSDVERAFIDVCLLPMRVFPT